MKPVEATAIARNMMANAKAVLAAESYPAPGVPTSMDLHMAIVARRRDELLLAAVLEYIDARLAAQPCERCGRRDDVTFEACPYASEVNDDYTPRHLCERCRAQRRDDI